MVTPTEIEDHERFFRTAVDAASSSAVRSVLAKLPIVSEDEYVFDETAPERGWQAGYLHWYPVGRDRGNAGRIKLAGSPENPIAERTINAMEALIELERRRELRAQPGTDVPRSPREAVLRYFDLPRLDQLPRWNRSIRGQKAFDYARDLARRIRVRLVRSTRPVEYGVFVDDDGIGQSPSRLHATLLSLGRSDKPDKPYLIGIFGQGGSSGYAVSDYSWLASCRAPEFLDGDDDGVGWTVVKRIFPAGRRDVYWAYLAAHPDGRVARLKRSAADAVGLRHGTRLAHLNYNFGKTEPAATLYQGLNHLLFNPVLPYELVTGPERRPDPMWGNGYRLSRLGEDKKALDKTFGGQTVDKRTE